MTFEHLMQRIQFICKPWKPWLSTFVLIGGFSLQIDPIKNQLPSNIVPWIAWGIVVLMLIMAILDWIDNKIENNKVDKITYVSRDVFRDHLKTIYNSLKLKHQERLSLFVHDEANKCFVLVGRYSLNTQYCKWGRGFYKEDQGVINEVWKVEHYIDFLDKDKTKRDTQNIQKFKMDQHTLNNLLMDTVGFWGIRLSDIKVTPIAVILMEASEKSSRVQTNKKEKSIFFDNYKQIVSQNSQDILKSLDLFKPFFPSPTNPATKGGF